MVLLLPILPSRTLCWSICGEFVCASDCLSVPKIKQPVQRSRSRIEFENLHR